jgi:hypothetical protein
MQPWMLTIVCVYGLSLSAVIVSLISTRALISHIDAVRAELRRDAEARQNRDQREWA